MPKSELQMSNKKLNFKNQNDKYLAFLHLFFDIYFEIRN